VIGGFVLNQPLVGKGAMAQCVGMYMFALLAPELAQLREVAGGSATERDALMRVLSTGMRLEPESIEIVISAVRRAIDEGQAESPDALARAVLVNTLAALRQKYFSSVDAECVAEAFARLRVLELHLMKASGTPAQSAEPSGAIKRFLEQLPRFDGPVGGAEQMRWVADRQGGWLAFACRREVTGGPGGDGV
jgi:hypothetical protein